MIENAASKLRFFVEGMGCCAERLVSFEERCIFVENLLGKWYMADVFDPAFESVVRALDTLRRPIGRIWTPERLAAAGGLSLFPFCEAFVRVTGVTPERFLLHWQRFEKHRVPRRCSDLPFNERFRSETDPVIPEGAHQVILQVESRSEKRSERREICYAFHPTLWGTAVVASSERGVCFLGWSETLRQAWEELRKQFPDADLREQRTAEQEQALAWLRVESDSVPVRVHLWGTEFQCQVWRALSGIRAGQLVSYGELARWIGRPTACRPVGSAVGDNPVSGLIPCHRVVQSSGRFGGYRWGLGRKRELLAWEAALQEREKCQSICFVYEDSYV